MRTVMLGLVTATLLAACGGTDAGGAGGAGASGGAGATGGAGGSGATGGSGGSGAGTAEWVELVAGDWEVPPGQEGFGCVRHTVTEDWLIQAFRPVIPAGTHHTVLTLDPGSTEPDGITRCDAGVNGPQMIYGSGVGTEDLIFPPGIAIRVPAGTQLVLNLHLYNSATTALTGTSGVLVQRMDPSALVHEAETVLAGKMDGLVVDPGPTTLTGVCTQTAAQHVFAAFPHMHTLGTHLRAVAHPATGPVTLLDTPYTFDDQRYHLFDAVPLTAGDRIDIECTYDNPGVLPVVFGDSTDDEMCFVGLYRYPRVVAPSHYCTR